MVEGSYPISLTQMAIGVVPVAVAVSISLYYKLGLTKSLIIGVIRATIQLFLIGYVLLYVFHADNPYLIATLIVLMIGVAAQAGSGRIKKLKSRRVKKIYRGVLFVSILLSSAVAAGWLQFVVIRPDPLWQGMYIIPLAGMMINQAMNASTLAIERYRSELQLQAPMIQSLLALGATQVEASRKVTQTAISAAMMPTINGLMVLGIVALPGMMSGQILSGVSPELALRYQLLVNFSMAASTSFASFLAVRFARRLYFTKDDQFIRPDLAEI